MQPGSELVPVEKTDRVPDGAGESAEVVAAGPAVYVAPAWKLTWWRFRKHKLAVACLWVFAVVALIALAPEFFATQDPNATAASNAYIPPQTVRVLHEGRVTWPFVYGVRGERNQRTLRMEWALDEETRYPLRLFARGYPYRLFGLIPTDRHLLGFEGATGRDTPRLLGTDRLGRDQWSRLMYGTRISLSIGLVAVALSTVLGIVLGGVSGYFGGWVDNVIQRLIELLQALPPIPIWLALSASLPRTWPVTWVYFAITVILALLGWTRLAREVRGRFLSLREEDFVTAARLVGASRSRVIFSHMVPSFTSHIIAAVTLAIPLMILNETFLSFLGLGLRPPAISWGVMLQEAQNLQSVVNAPWLLIPGLLVIVTVLALNILGDGLRDAADPYSS
ncbi:MAG TPA: ABC transporter permease [Trueperaceae bacterium]|nr:ABC transporter permease [Trueperaceae bacterium]